MSLALQEFIAESGQGMRVINWVQAQEGVQGVLGGAQSWVTTNFGYVVEIWNRGALGLKFGDIFIIAGILLVSLLIRGVFARTVVRAITKAAADTETKIDDAIVSAVSTPLKLVPVIVGIYFALEVVSIENEKVSGSLDNIIQSIITIAVFWTLSRAVGAFDFAFSSLRDSMSSAVVDWLLKLIQLLLVAFGVVAVAQIWGFPILPLMTSLGVFGIAIGLGAQDLFKNLISGILILTEKRFLPGEWIAVDGVVEGTVERINFRSTLVRRFDKSPVFVPNGLLSDNPVINYSRMSHRRIKWVVGVEYRTTTAQLKFIRDEIEAWLWNDTRFAKPPTTALFVRIDRFNDCSIDFLIYCFTNTKNWGEWLAIKEEFAFVIMDIIEKSGSSFAFPSSTVYLQQQDPPEILQPPAPSDARQRAEALIAAFGTNQARGDG